MGRKDGANILRHNKTVATTTLAFLMLVLAVGFAGIPSPATMPRSFTLYVNGQPHTIVTRAVAFGQALAESGFKVGLNDKIFPSPDTRITQGMKARIIRVTEKTITVDEKIEPQTQRRYSGSLRPGTARIVSPGAVGAARKTYKVTFADGVRTSRELLGTTVVKQPQPRVVEVSKNTTLPSRGFSSRKILVMEATAYDPGPRSCGKFADGRTSTGMRAGYGVVAVDPRVIPMGSRLYIEGYGFAIAGDRGSAIKGHKIDLGHDTYRAAVQFGRRKVVVHVLK